MCSATDGAAPVWACTCAASASFSRTVRGVPAAGHTRKRVPELPNAHEGSSIATRASCVSAGWTSVVTGMVEPRIVSDVVPRRRGLTLDRSGDHARHDLAVEEDVHDQRWDGDEQDVREQQVVGAHVLALEIE